MQRIFMGMLSVNDFLAVVDNAPLVSIDLVVTDEQGYGLLGERRNRPAQGFWFVPGGRIRKNETLDAAFLRLTREEIGLECARQSRQLLGVYEHFYNDNFAGMEGSGTHYVVLAYALSIQRDLLQAPDDQHTAYRWALPRDIAVDASVHPNTRCYFVQ
jgi:colanic acid biosynthesis protein WcaH